METPEKTAEVKKEKSLPRPAQYREGPNPALAQRRERKLMVYVGPSRPFGLPLMQNAVLQRGALPQVEETMAANPAFARLFVDVADLAQVRDELKTEGSPLWLVHQEVIKSSREAKAEKGA